MSNMYVIPYYPIGSVLEFDRAIDMNSIYVDTKGESVPMNVMNPYIVVYRYHKIAD